MSKMSWSRPSFRRICGLLLGGVLLSVSGGQELFAANGLKPSGFGARYSALGGTSVGIGGSIGDLESNPAHLADLKRSVIDISSGFSKGQVTYQDSYADPDLDLAYNNKVKGKQKDLVPLPMVGFMGPIGERFGWGVAIYAQGGVAEDMEGVVRTTSNRGTLNSVLEEQNGDHFDLGVIGEQKRIRESYFTQFSFIKLSPGVAFKITDKLNIGVGVDFGYAKLALRYTYQDITGSFDIPGTGINYKSDPAYSLSAKIGLVYKPTEDLKLAYSYRGKTRFYLDGTVSLNAGNPKYYNKNGVSAYLEWPEIHTVGFSYKIGGLLIAVDVEYIMWSTTYKTVDLYFDQAWYENPIGFNSGELSFGLDYRDQPVFKIGLEYQTGSLVFRVGGNYGASMVTSRGVNPIFPAVTKANVSAGFGIRKENWELDFAVNYALPNRVHGERSSNWHGLHAIYSGLDYRSPQFGHSAKLEIVTPYIGFKYKL